jgi:hypothetical protein
MDDAAERRQKSDQHGHHGEPSLSFNAGKLNGVSTYEVFAGAPSSTTTIMQVRLW